MCTIRQRQSGLTLIELIVFIVVIGIGLAGILTVMNVTVRHSADPMVRKQALALANAVMEEIMLKEYADPDSSGGETSRDTFDDVDDYNGKSNSMFTDLPTTLSGYTIGIVVADNTTLGSVAAKKITVTVSGGNESVSLVSYRTSY